MANTIEKIEKSYWGPPPPNTTHVVETCHRLRQKDLAQFTVEDLRFMIGQSMALEILMPSAMVILDDDLYAEGDFYPGDLLMNVLHCDIKYWQKHPDVKEHVIVLVEKNIPQLLSTTSGELRQLRKAFAQFKAS